MTRRIPLIAGMILIVLLAGWYVALWRPSTAQVRSARAAEVTAQSHRVRLEGELAGLVEAKKKLPTLETQLGTGVTAVPTSPSVDVIISQINMVAVKDSVVLTNESQSLSTVAAPTSTAATGATSSAPGAGNSTLSLTLAVAGSYPAMSKFITDIQHLPRLVILDTMSFSPAVKDGVSVSISARAFYDSTPIPKLPQT